MKKYKKFALILCVALMVSMLFCTPAFAAGGDVAGAIEGTWNDASGQIKTVVNNVVFPAMPFPQGGGATPGYNSPGYGSTPYGYTPGGYGNNQYPGGFDNRYRGPLNSN